VIADSSIDTYVTFEKGKVSFKDFSHLTAEQLQAIESIKEGRNGLELKLHGKSWSLEMIAKHIGFYEKDNKQKTPGTDVDLNQLSREAIGELLNAIKPKDQ
jgi:phage terminase small subunit